MNLEAIELKAFIPARDLRLSQAFYRDLGFNMPWSSDELAYFYAGPCSFLLQKASHREHTLRLRMHLLVEDVDAWWNHVCVQCLSEKYEVNTQPPADCPWGVREFEISDPSGVTWRIGTSLAMLRNRNGS